MPKKITRLEDLCPDTRNANKGKPYGIGILEDSLRQFGAGRSILADKEGRVIAGNKTLEKIAELGLGIRVVETDGTELVVVQRTDLDLEKDARAKGLAIADNRTSELNLDWDLENLTAQLADVDNVLGSLSGTGYTADELDRLISELAGSQTQAPAPEDFQSYDENIETEYRCPKCSYEWSGKPA